MSPSAPRLRSWLGVFRTGGRPLRLDLGCDTLLAANAGEVAEYRLPAPIRGRLPDTAPLQGLRDLLARLLPCGRALDVTISDALARSWVVERPPGLGNEAEVAALARLAMREIYGDSANEAAAWALEVDAQPFVQAWPVVALPQALLDALRAAAATRDCTLVALQPRFVRCFNRRTSGWKPALRPSRPTICVLEAADEIAVGIHRGKQWLDLRCHPPLAALGLDLATLIRRDCRAAGIAVESCRVRHWRWSSGKARETP